MIKKVALANGVRILTEEIPYVRSVAIGIWVRVGSRDELPGQDGITHFIEHLMFKGTENRTAKELAEALDSVGGQLNAFTSKEYTCYYAKVLDDHLELALDVLTDMFFNSRFGPNEIEKEKNVVLEEIKMYEDTPDDQVHDLFTSTIWQGHSLGRPIIGTKERVMSFSRDDVLNYFNHHYVPTNTVIAVAGSIDHLQVVERLGKIFGQWSGPPIERQLNRPESRYEINIKNKDIEQVHLCLGVQALPMEHPDIYVLHILNSIAGGGLSSRLFQNIREERGLAYSVYSYHSSYQETGFFAVYAGLSRNNLEDTIQLVMEELSNFRNHGVTPEELTRAKEQLKGSLFLGLENVSSRMSRLGKTELCYGRVITPDEIVEKINHVEIEQVRRLAEDLLKPHEFSLTAIGPMEENLNLTKFLK
ncbi:MAG: pitrilysin family protein [Clostridia bacterium]|nr:pitrilysin family protein [Clostridia bacterium]